MKTNFTLFNILNNISKKWIEEEKKKSSSIVGNFIKDVEQKGKLRDAQLEAIIIYLWLKEVGERKRITELIKENIIFKNETISNEYNGDYDYKEKPIKRYLNRYFKDAKIDNIDEYLRLNIEDSEYEKLLDQLFEDFDYPNYLFSLPMGAGKTFLIAAFIYIDLYMLLKTKDTKRYSSNFIILIPSAKKTAILPSLKTIKYFNPRWIFNEADSIKLKNIIKIEILDEYTNGDKLHNQNPNVSKINKTMLGNNKGNVFILNAEKVIPDIKNTEKVLDKAQITKIKNAEQLKETLASIKNIQIFIDEAHHSYSEDSSKKKLRYVLDVINKYNNIDCCIGMSGTPYVNRKIKFHGKELKLEDIQDIVYYYPLTKAIGNFLKTPEIKKVDADENVLIETALNEFFERFDIQYKNKAKSKIAFYCSSTDILNEKVLPIIIEWYEKKGRDRNEIFKYYTNTSKYPLTPNAEQDFLSLDSPNSKYRIILLVAIGTEGWDCRSLASVVLPRNLNNKSSKNFVLQTTCRCLREMDKAGDEKALIYLNEANFETLDKQLGTNYHLKIDDINQKLNYKSVPVCKIKDSIGKLTYYNIREKYVEIVKEEPEDFKQYLKQYNFNDFKTKYPFSNQITIATINENSLKENVKFKDLENRENIYSFNDFMYNLEKSSFGLISCGELCKYKDELQRVYKDIILKENISWLINHPTISFYDICKDITSNLTTKTIVKKEKIKEKVEIDLLDWNMDENPTINIREDDKNLIYPSNLYDDLSGDYIQDKEILMARYKYIMNIPNKQKSFNYIPYKVDSTYEYDFLKNILGNLDDIELEIYYNGYTNESLKSFRIITPYSKYTPDFLVLKRNENKEITKILIVETKAKPFETPLIESFVKNEFIKANPKFAYIRIGDTQKNVNEYNKIVDKIKEFAL